MKALAILILMVSAIAVIGGTAVASSSILGTSAMADDEPQIYQHEICEQEQSGSNEYQYQWNCEQNCSLECQQHEYSHEYEYSFNSNCTGDCQDNEFQHMNSNGQE